MVVVGSLDGCGWLEVWIVVVGSLDGCGWLEVWMVVVGWLWLVGGLDLIQYNTNTNIIIVALEVEVLRPQIKLFHNYIILIRTWFI